MNYFFPATNHLGSIRILESLEREKLDRNELCGDHPPA